MRHAFRDFSRFVRGKTPMRAKPRADTASGLGSSDRRVRLDELAHTFGDPSDSERLVAKIVETVRQEIDRLDGYLAYQHERTLRELEARIGPRVVYSSPTVDAIISYGAFDLVVPTTEEALLAHLLRNGSGGCDPGIYAMIETRVRPGATIIEIGGGVGLHTLPLAAAVGLSGKVYSFEPVPRLASALARSIRLNGFNDRVALHRTDATALEQFSPGRGVDLVLVAAESIEPQVRTVVRRIAAENPQLEIVCTRASPRSTQLGCDPAAFERDLRPLGFRPYRIEPASDGAVLIPVSDLTAIDSALLVLTRQGER